jgi:hypothetical protein
MEPDILYAVRHGERNAALRLSLRSLGNLPHRRVFIAGFCPSWVQGVTVVETPRRANKYDSIEENVRRGLRHPEMGDEVVYMNDDFYITEPIDRVPITHAGPVAEYNGRQELRIRMRQTTHLFVRDGYHVQFEGMLSYDGVHMPLPLERDHARITLDNIPRGLLWRTWYGNLNAIGGERVANTKYKGTYPVPTKLPTFLSTNAGGLKVTKELLEDTLPSDCKYVS